MDRLTYKSCMGDYGATAEFSSKDEEISRLRNALGRYEDIGYTPVELAAIIKIVKNIKDRKDNA